MLPPLSVFGLSVRTLKTRISVKSGMELSFVTSRWTDCILELIQTGSTSKQGQMSDIVSHR